MRGSQHEIHLSTLDKHGDADFCMCKTCRPSTARTELVRTNLSNSDRNNTGHDGEPKDYSYDHKKTPPPKTWPPTCQYNPQVPCICWGYEIPCPHKGKSKAL